MDEIDYHHYYPIWLGDALLRHTLSWDTALSVPMPLFLEQYSLHDSVWESLWVEPAYGEAIAIMRWDSFWSDGRIPYPEYEDGYDLEGRWPLLLIRFQRVYQIVATQISFDKPLDFPDVIFAAYSRKILTDEREEVLTIGLRQPISNDNTLTYLLDDELHQTRFIGQNDERKAEILHSGAIQLLCFDPSGVVLPIPDL